MTARARTADAARRRGCADAAVAGVTGIAYARIARSLAGRVGVARLAARNGQAAGDWVERVARCTNAFRKGATTADRVLYTRAFARARGKRCAGFSVTDKPRVANALRGGEQTSAGCVHIASGITRRNQLAARSVESVAVIACAGKNVVARAHASGVVQRQGAGARAFGEHTGSGVPAIGGQHTILANDHAVFCAAAAIGRANERTLCAHERRVAGSRVDNGATAGTASAVSATAASSTSARRRTVEIFFHLTCSQEHQQDRSFHGVGSVMSDAISNRSALVG